MEIIARATSIVVMVDSFNAEHVIFSTKELAPTRLVLHPPQLQSLLFLLAKIVVDSACALVVVVAFPCVGEYSVIMLSQSYIRP